MVDDPRMRTYAFTRWSGFKSRVTVERVEFMPGGVITFWTGDKLELAVREYDWNNLYEVDTDDEVAVASQ